MQGHAEKCVGQKNDLPSRKISDQHKTQSPCIHDHIFSVEYFENEENIGKTARRCWLCSFFHTNWKTRSSIEYRTFTM